mgnify:CR=1 FL=1
MRRPSGVQTLASSTASSRLSPSAGLFSRLRIGTRLYGGFGLVLILLIAVAGIGISGLATMASQFTGYAAISRTTVNVVAIDRTVVGLRRNVAQFAQTRDEKALQRIAELRNDFETLLQEARAETDEDERDFLDRMEKIFRDYLTQFDSVIEILRTRDAIERDTLLPIGNRMVAKLDEAIGIATRAGDHAIAGQLSGGAQHLLLARLSAVRFLNSPSTELRAEIEKEFDLLTLALNGLFGSVHNTQINSLLMEVANLASEYTQAYDRFADLLMAASNTINGPMENLAAELASLATTANSAQRVELGQIEARASEVSAAAQTIGIVVSIVAVVLGVLCAWLIARGIVRPVTGMTDAMRRLAANDMNVEIPGRERGDEIGDMAGAVQVFKENMIEAERMRAEQAAENEAKLRRAEEMAAAIAEFERAAASIVEALSSSASEMHTSAQALSATAEQTTRQATAVAAASEQASSNVHTVAAAGEELSSSIAEIGRQVTEASHIANHAVEEAQRTDGMIQGLAETAQRIGDVVGLINDIASQTNLLALNATIEAARAGEAGKGFAVVASEVKQLANQTAKATDEIAQQVGAIQTATKGAVEAIKGVGRTINNINEIASGIAAAVEEQGAATEEIARNVQQAAAGTQEVTANITGVTQAAGETGSAATQVLGAAGELARQAELLRSQVDMFLTRVRSA